MEDSRANAILRMLLDASSQASKLRSEVAAMRGDKVPRRGVAEAGRGSSGSSLNWAEGLNCQ